MLNSPPSRPFPPGIRDFQPGFKGADTSGQAAVPRYGVYDWTPPNVWPAMQAYLLRFGIMTDSYEARAALRTGFAIAANRRASAAVLRPARLRDVFAPARQARHFVEQLRAAGGTTVYGELPGAQHAFDLFSSLRAASTADAVGRFLSVAHSQWLRPGAGTC